MKYCHLINIIEYDETNKKEKNRKKKIGSSKLSPGLAPWTGAEAEIARMATADTVGSIWGRMEAARATAAAARGRRRATNWKESSGEQECSV